MELSNGQTFRDAAGLARARLTRREAGSAPAAHVLDETTQPTSSLGEKRELPLRDEVSR
jgi:hypothetical protein